MLSYKLTDEAELRLLMPHHAAAHAALVQKNLHRLQRWLPFVTPDFDEARARELINRYLKRLAEDEAMLLGIFYQNEFAGWIAFREWIRRNQTTEIGYWIGEEFEGKGLITKAVQAMIRYAFTELGMNRVEILMEVENVRSAAVPERLGFTMEGVKRQGFWVHGQPRDVYVYALLKDEWLATS